VLPHTRTHGKSFNPSLVVSSFARDGAIPPPGKNKSIGKSAERTVCLRHAVGQKKSFGVIESLGE
jgi:hypothetical protein